MSVQPSVRGSNDLRVGRKMATFQLCIQSGRAKGLSAPLYYTRIRQDESVTNPKQQSPWRASGLVPQLFKKSPILWNPKAHYRLWNSPPLVPIHGQIIPARIFPTDFFSIHFNIILPSTSRSSKRSSITGWIFTRIYICHIADTTDYTVLSVHFYSGLQVIGQVLQICYTRRCPRVHHVQVSARGAPFVQMHCFICNIWKPKILGGMRSKGWMTLSA